VRKKERRCGYGMSWLTPSSRGLPCRQSQTDHAASYLDFTLLAHSAPLIALRSHWKHVITSDTHLLYYSQDPSSVQQKTWKTQQAARTCGDIPSIIRQHPLFIQGLPKMLHVCPHRDLTASTPFHQNCVKSGCIPSLVRSRTMLEAVVENCCLGSAFCVDIGVTHPIAYEDP